MFKHHLIAALMLVFCALAASSPAPLPQDAITGPPGQVIIDTWFVHNFNGSKPKDLYQLRVPLDSRRYNVQELHCYNYSLKALNVVSHDRYNCAVMRMYWVFYLDGPPCQFTDDWSKPYDLIAPKNQTKWVTDSENRRVRTVCCGYDCKYMAPVMPPPAWYLKTDTQNEDAALNPSTFGTTKKVVAADISSVLDDVSSASVSDKNNGAGTV